MNKNIFQSGHVLQWQTQSQSKCRLSIRRRHNFAISFYQTPVAARSSRLIKSFGSKSWLGEKETSLHRPTRRVNHKGSALLVKAHYRRPFRICQLCLSFYPRPNISDRFPSHFIFVGDTMNTSQSKCNSSKKIRFPVFNIAKSFV